MAAATGAAGDAAPDRAGGRRAAAAAVVTVPVLLAGLAVSVSIGTADVDPVMALAALLAADPDPAQLIVRSIRLPRALLGLLVGSSMGMSGAVMQGITTNPLAAPEILGVSAGAATVVVGALVLVPAIGGGGLIAAAMAGGAATGLLVLLLAGAGAGRVGNVRLALAGVTVTALLTSLTQTFVIFNDNTANNVFFWLVGGVNFAQAGDVWTLLPWTLAGGLAALAIASPLNLIGLGEDVARGLGVRTDRTRVIGGAVIVALTGAAVAVAGPVGFIGLMTPHLVRRLARTTDHFAVIPLSALVGGTLLVYADIGARFVRWPFESPTGVVTALIGTPFFVLLARHTRTRG